MRFIWKLDHIISTRHFTRSSGHMFVYWDMSPSLPFPSLALSHVQRKGGVSGHHAVHQSGPRIRSVRDDWTFSYTCIACDPSILIHTDQPTCHPL